MERDGSKRRFGIEGKGAGIAEDARLVLCIFLVPTTTKIKKTGVPRPPPLPTRSSAKMVLFVSFTSIKQWGRKKEGFGVAEDARLVFCIQPAARRRWRAILCRPKGSQIGIGFNDTTSTCFFLVFAQDKSCFLLFTFPVSQKSCFLFPPTQKKNCQGNVFLFCTVLLLSSTKRGDRGAREGK